MVEVVNKNRGGVGVYIGRGSIFGNQFVIGVDGNRDQVIEKYRGWFLEQVKNQWFRERVWELEGEKLMCFCSPARCHGDVLKWWLELGEEGVGEE